MPEDLVSVILPAYNAGRFIGEAIGSALAQSHRNIEVVVVDDGSTDRTAAIVGELAARDARVQLIQQPNAGVAAARNRGIASARGELIALLDADDVWHPEKLARQLSVLNRTGPAVALVYCWYRDIDESGTVIGSPYGLPHAGDVYARLLLVNFVGNASTPLIRRSCLPVGEPFDPNLRAQGAQGAEDVKLYLTLAERYHFALVPQFLVGYRQSPASMSKDAFQMKRSLDLVLSEAQRRHPELPARVFRWARARTRIWLGSRRLQSAGVRAAAPAFLSAALLDPAAVLNVCLPGLRRRVGRERHPAAMDHVVGNGVRSLPFAALAPESGVTTPSTSRLDQRRFDYLASLRIRRGQ